MKEKKWRLRVSPPGPRLLEQYLAVSQAFPRLCRALARWRARSGLFSIYPAELTWRVDEKWGDARMAKEARSKLEAARRRIGEREHWQVPVPKAVAQAYQAAEGAVEEYEAAVRLTAPERER